MALFQKHLPKAEVTPVFKKGDPTPKTDYRPVSTLSNSSNIFEKLIYLQLNKTNCKTNFQFIPQFFGKTMGLTTHYLK